MKMNKYRNQLAVFLLWAVCVIVFFKFIPDRQIAALLAGAGFIIWPSLFLFLELKSPNKSKIHVFALSLFLVAAALPIFLLRVIHWGEDFGSLTLFGLPAVNLHQTSNVFYLIVMVSCFYNSWVIERRRRREELANPSRN
ncbi:MAG: hypothetical protein H7328_05140 [Bdellovibrio sp.]|nr:hypothetical protein [Bdellovibrio sp.]